MELVGLERDKSECGISLMFNDLKEVLCTSSNILRGAEAAEEAAAAAAVVRYQRMRPFFGGAQ